MPKYYRQTRPAKAGGGRLAQLSAKRAAEYEMICFRSRRMRPLVLPLATYRACGTGTLCRED
ncbi:MAG: hypothetical protein E5X89_09970 [Mesorhizobium sp.]|nr:MAG: hypothetical protein E5X89_09970 [Mesorhizobium sp.]TIP08438.1 MAG: hypothetical protein E5X73_32025 [Mesorhizobium sp.]